MKSLAYLHTHNALILFKVLEVQFSTQNTVIVLNEC